jgi:hypothetical protein
VSPSPHLRKEADKVPETLCFLVVRIPDGVAKSRNPAILTIEHVCKQFLLLSHLYIYLFPKCICLFRARKARHVKV